MSRIQLTTDALQLYIRAGEDTFDYGSIDHAILHKVSGESQGAAGRYSPADCTAIVKRAIQREPDLANVSPSHVERRNLTIHMGMRPFTRPTNVFSTSLENTFAATALHFVYYHFGRPHQTLSNGTYPTTPAMTAGVKKHPWIVEEILPPIEYPEGVRQFRNQTDPLPSDLRRQARPVRVPKNGHPATDTGTQEGGA